MKFASFTKSPQIGALWHFWTLTTGKTKDEEEEEYIEKGSEPSSDSYASDEDTDTEATNPKKDLSQRPDQ